VLSSGAALVDILLMTNRSVMRLETQAGFHVPRFYGPLNQN